MRSLMTLLVCGAVVITGCQTKSLKVSSYNSDNPATKNGVVYSLPKTLLKITVPYTVVKRTRVVDGVTTLDPPTVEVRKPVKVEPVLVADSSNIFVLDGAQLANSIWLDSSTKVSLASNLMLSGVEADVTDKGPEVTESLVSTAMTLAKLAVAAGEAKGEPVASIKSRLKEINDAIAEQVKALKTADDATRAKINTRIGELAAERKMLLDLVKAYEASNSEVVELTDIDYAITVDPSDSTTFRVAQADHRSYELTPPSSLFGVGAITPTPVWLNVYKDEAAMKTAGTAIPASSTEGILYRPAVPVRVTVTIGTENALDGLIPMAQYGKVAIAEAKYKPWAKMKTVVKFDAATGGLAEYGVDATSSAEKAAKVLDGSATKLSTTLGEIQKMQADAAAAAAAKPAADLDAQKKLVQAQFDLDKLMAEYEKWKKENGVKP